MMIENNPLTQHQENLILPDQDNNKLMEIIISEHNSLREKYQLPDTDLIFKSDGPSNIKILQDKYCRQLAQIAYNNNIVFIDDDQSKEFFQKYPELGVFHPNLSNHILINPRKIRTHIDKYRIYNNVSYLADLTIELTHALVSQSSPEISPQELCQKAALSIFSSTLLNSCFHGVSTKDFFSRAESLLIIHQEITP